MRLEQIAVKILINAYKYRNEAEAIAGLKSEFEHHFPTFKYEEWNKEVADSVAENIIKNVGKNSTVSVRFIIKDLEIIAKSL